MRAKNLIVDPSVWNYPKSEKKRFTSQEVVKMENERKRKRTE
jgi:hypothetical protein